MLTRYNPRGEAVSLRDAVGRLFQDAMVAPSLGMAAGGADVAPMDVRETDDAYEVRVSLPGWRPEDISATIQGDTVTISGQPRPEPPERHSGRYHLRERRLVSFSRSFTFPTAVDADRVEARFEDGELILRLPKDERARPHRIAIGRAPMASPAGATGAAPRERAAGESRSDQPRPGRRGLAS
jgi:HSP20 family protein